MPQQNNNPNARQQNLGGENPDRRNKDQPHKMAPSHGNRPKQAQDNNQDNNQNDKPGRKATSNNNR